MKILVTINQGSNPELHAALEIIPPRERAERVRTLATLGDVISRKGLQVMSATPDMPLNRLETGQALAKLKNSLTTEE